MTSTDLPTSAENSEIDASTLVYRTMVTCLIFFIYRFLVAEAMIIRVMIFLWG